MSRKKHRQQKPLRGGLTTDLSTPLNSLVKCIEAIPGQRIMTLLLSDGRHVVVDIDDHNHYGYDPFVKPLLLAKLTTGLATGGTIILRQFTSLKAEMPTPRGPKLLPIKNLYGIVLGEAQWRSMTKNELEFACTHDIKGKPLEREPNVRFLELPVIKEAILDTKPQADSDNA